MSDKNLKIYCVTNKEVNFINDKTHILSWAGDESPPENYVSCNTGENIYYKEKFYSELTFHYWYWKNILPNEDEDDCIVFCQKRRYWIKVSSEKNINKQNLNDYLITEPLKNWSEYDAIICKPIKVSLMQANAPSPNAVSVRPSAASRAFDIWSYVSIEVIPVH